MKSFRLAMLSVLLLVSSGCATTPPTRLATIDPLVGKWFGTVTIGRSVNPINLTINADRSLIAIWGSITARGTVTVTDGQASYQMGPPLQEGSIKLYTGKGKPELYMESMNGEFYAVVEPQRN